MYIFVCICVYVVVMVCGGGGGGGGIQYSGGALKPLQIFKHHSKHFNS